MIEWLRENVSKERKRSKLLISYINNIIIISKFFKILSLANLEDRIFKEFLKMKYAASDSPMTSPNFSSVKASSLKRGAFLPSELEGGVLSGEDPVLLWRGMSTLLRLSEL